MNFSELLEYLDIEDPSQFIYFEAMADLIESDEPIEQEAVQALFEGADGETMAELFDDYFEEILDGLPEDSSEIYSLLHQIKLSLMGMATNNEDDGDIRRFADSFCRFREWYCYDSLVVLSPDGEGEEMEQSLRDAITSARMEKLGADTYRYDFTGAMDYPLDSYEVSLASLMATEYGDEEEAYVPDIPEDEDDNGYIH